MMAEPDLFEIIHDESKIKNLYAALLLKLRGLTDKEVSANICTPNKIDRKTVHWSDAHSFWWCEFPGQKLAFGLSCPEENDFVSTPCYFTIPPVYNYRCGGAFAADENGKPYLINKGNFFLIEYHTNKIIPSKKIVDEYYAGRTAEAAHNNKVNKVIVVGCIEQVGFSEKLVEFVSEIYGIKERVENPKDLDGKRYESIDQKDIDNLRKTKKVLSTIGESLFWSYANLGAVHAALKNGDKKLHRIHYVIRSKLYNGLANGTMKISSMYKDERQKLMLPRCCCYCAGEKNLSADHVIPRKKGGIDSGENLIWCCRSCNSSKSSKDLLEWLFGKNEFPSILLLRRYLKLSIQFCNDNNILNSPIDQVENLPVELPFSINAIPYYFPNLNKLKIWIVDFEGMNSV